MIVKKEIKDDNEFYLWFNGQLIFKKWLNTGVSKVLDHSAWGKYTERSITDFDLEDTPPVFSVKCNLHLLSSKEGGKQLPISNGYRPDHVFEFEEDGRFKYAFIGDLQFENEIKPGESAIVTARFLSHQPIEQYLEVGRVWSIFEGNVKVGELEMIKS